ncbi:MAG: MFS transporter [Verrucomicrobiae bacterium]|nr:MFS transporter [Verrucomicrobiae bacterium]
MAWVFGAVWMYVITGATLTQFAKLLGVSKAGFGLLAAMPFAGCLFQLPLSYVIERYGHRKRLFICLGIVHRAMWLVVAAIPWVLPAGMHAQAMIVVVALSWAVGQMIGPAWVSWMADLVPERIRGRYFSRRSQAGQIVGLVTTVLVGVVLDQAAGRGADALLRAASAALAVAGVSGMIDFLFFLPVIEPLRRQPNPNVRLRQLLVEPLRDGNFRTFLVYTALLTFSLGYINQFVWLYVLDVAAMSNTAANAMLVLVPLVIFMGMYPVWGRLIDRLGRKPVLIVCTLVLSLGAVSWIFVTRERWLPGFALVTIATMMWPGVELGNFNVLLGLSTAREDSRQRSAHVAINSTVAAISGIVSGIFGGVVAQRLEHWHGSFFGLPLTFHGVLFLIAGGLRVVAALWLVRLEDPGAETTRAALRYMGANLYSNLQQAVFVPGRLLWQVARWTYRLGRGR